MPLGGIPQYPNFNNFGNRWHIVLPFSWKEYVKSSRFATHKLTIFRIPRIWRMGRVTYHCVCLIEQVLHLDASLPPWISYFGKIWKLQEECGYKVSLSLPPCNRGISRDYGNFEKRLWHITLLPHLPQLGSGSHVDVTNLKCLLAFFR